jgi:hypothetical protein
VFAKTRGGPSHPLCFSQAITTEDETDRVTVLPIIYTQPKQPELAIEIPAATKKRLGLDDDRSWVVLTEANRFTCPDLRLIKRGEQTTVL